MESYGRKAVRFSVKFLKRPCVGGKETLRSHKEGKCDQLGDYQLVPRSSSVHSRRRRRLRRRYCLFLSS